MPSFRRFLRLVQSEPPAVVAQTSSESATEAEWRGGFAPDGSLFMCRKSASGDEWYTIPRETAVFDLTAARIERAGRPAAALRAVRVTRPGTASRSCVLGVSSSRLSARGREG